MRDHAYPICDQTQTPHPHFDQQKRSKAACAIKFPDHCDDADANSVAPDAKRKRGRGRKPTRAIENPPSFEDTASIIKAMTPAQFQAARDTGLRTVMNHVGVRPELRPVLQYLASATNQKTGICFPSLKTISEQSGRGAISRESKRNMRRCIRSLEGLGLLASRQRDNSYGTNAANEYAVLALAINLAEFDASNKVTPTGDTKINCDELSDPHGGSVCPPRGGCVPPPLRTSQFNCLKEQESSFQSDSSGAVEKLKVEKSDVEVVSTFTERTPTSQQDDMLQGLGDRMSPLVPKVKNAKAVTAATLADSMSAEMQDAFAKFWATYPKARNANGTPIRSRHDRKKSAIAWCNLVAGIKGTPVSVADLQLAAERYAVEIQSKEAAGDVGARQYIRATNLWLARGTAQTKGSTFETYLGDDDLETEIAQPLPALIAKPQAQPQSPGERRAAAAMQSAIARHGADQTVVDILATPMLDAAHAYDKLADKADLGALIADLIEPVAHLPAETLREIARDIRQRGKQLPSIGDMMSIAGAIRHRDIKRSVGATLLAEYYCETNWRARTDKDRNRRIEDAWDPHDPNYLARQGKVPVRDADELLAGIAADDNELEWLVAISRGNNRAPCQSDKHSPLISRRTCESYAQIEPAANWPRDRFHYTKDPTEQKPKYA